MSATQAPERTAVRFRHRRRPPILQFGLIGAAFVGLVAFATTVLALQVALIAAAVLLAALAVLGRRRIWVEDQLITDEGVAVVRPDGEHVEIPFERVLRATHRGTGVEFLRDDGRTLLFARNPRSRRMRAVLADVAPSVEWVDAIDLACDT